MYLSTYLFGVSLMKYRWLVKKLKVIKTNLFLRLDSLVVKCRNSRAEFPEFEFGSRSYQL